MPMPKSKIFGRDTVQMGQSKPVQGTLAHHAQLGEPLIASFMRCRHVGRINLERAARKVGWGAFANDILNLLRCSQCKAKEPLIVRSLDRRQRVAYRSNGD